MLGKQKVFFLLSKSCGVTELSLRLERSPSTHLPPAPGGPGAAPTGPGACSGARGEDGASSVPPYRWILLRAQVTEGEAELRAAPDGVPDALGRAWLWLALGQQHQRAPELEQWSRASLEGCSALTVTILAGMKAQPAQTPPGQGGILPPAP